MNCRKDHSSVSHVMAIINVKNIIIGFFGLILLGFIANVTQLQEVQRESSGTEQRAEILPVTQLQEVQRESSGTEQRAEILPVPKQAQHIHIEDHETRICELREKIVNYRPGEWTLRDVSDEFERPPKIRLGVFGVQCSGKSTLLNSLHFSLTGTWKQVYTESRNCGTGGETMFRGFMKLTDHVTTVDTRAISDFSALRVDDVMAEISGNRGIDPHKRHRGEEIDCPIFVFKYSVDTGMEPCRAYIFLSALIEETKNRFGAYPIMVIPFGDSVADKDQILDEIINTGMPRSNVFFIENYTKDYHEMIEERHVTLLKILEACILRADDNIAFRWTKEKEIPWWKKWWKIANQN